MPSPYRAGDASHPTRRCRQCGVDRRIAYARRNLPEYGDGVYLCKYCQPSKRGRNATFDAAAYSQEWNLQRRYGISSEQYAQMLADQGGVCAICKKPPKVRRLYVDHDHETGRVRGLLCAHCNSCLEWQLQFGAEASQYVLGLITKG